MQFVFHVVFLATRWIELPWGEHVPPMALRVLFLTNAAKSVGATTFSVRNIRECHRPQNSVHWPGKVPMVVGVNVKRVGCVGMAFLENRSAGMKKPCITSLEIRVT